MTTFSRILTEIDKLNKKMDVVIKNFEIEREKEKQRFRNINLNDEVFKLPDKLRQSIMVVRELNQASATDVSKRTGYTRAIESSKLNELVRLGWCQKKRRGRNVIFFIYEEDNLRKDKHKGNICIETIGSPCSSTPSNPCAYP